MLSSRIIRIFTNYLAFIESILNIQNLLLFFINFHEHINIISNDLFCFVWACGIGNFLKVKHLLVFHSKVLFTYFLILLNCILSCLFIFQLNNQGLTSKFSYYDLTLSTPTIMISFYLAIYYKKLTKLPCSAKRTLSEAEIVVSSSKIKSIYEDNTSLELPTTVPFNLPAASLILESIYFNFENDYVIFPPLFSKVSVTS